MVILLVYQGDMEALLTVFTFFALTRPYDRLMPVTRTLTIIENPPSPPHVETSTRREDPPEDPPEEYTIGVPVMPAPKEKKAYSEVVVR